MQDTLIGRQLGAYQIQTKLGEGGMARVYKAYHARLRREVAIKVILSEIADQGDFQARFEREAQLIASLQHPNIVAVYDFGELDGLTYLIMQYVGGGTLREQLRDGQPVEPRRAANYIAQMARALHHAHQHGVVHRDVKPQNMLVSSTDPNLLLLSDFGIAKLFDNSVEVTRMFTPGEPGMIPHDPSLTSADQIIGTAHYMAPEQVQRQPVDARTDVYALGVVLFQMATGQMPFDGTTSAALMYQQVYSPPKTVRLANPTAPDMLGRITAMALEKSPADRFQTAEAMARALDAFIASPTTTQFNTRTSQGTQWNPSAPLTPMPASYQLGQTMLPPTGNLTGARTGYVSQAAPNTSIGTSAVPVPVKRRSTRLSTVQTVVTLLITALLVGFAVFKLLPSATSGTPTTPVATAASPFSETFTDNSRIWPSGTINGLTASVDAANHQYQLSIADANIYFPTPREVGTLPPNFTLTASFQQTAGDTTGTTVPYGLAFHMTYNGSSMQSGYAFVIYSSGICAFLRYDNAKLNDTFTKFQQTAQVQTAINANKVRVITVQVKGNSIAVMINGTSVGQYTDAKYTGGHLGLYVAGQGASFNVTKVALAFP